MNSTAERDIIIRNIYDQLKNNREANCSVQQDRVNRVKLVYNEGPGLRSTIVTYIVIILPIIFNLDPLLSITGRVDFHLDTTIKKLTDLLTKLKSFQGSKVIEENTHVETLEQLVRCLS